MTQNINSLTRSSKGKRARGALEKSFYLVEIFTNLLWQLKRYFVVNVLRIRDPEKLLG